MCALIWVYLYLPCSSYQQIYLFLTTGSGWNCKWLCTFIRAFSISCSSVQGHFGVLQYWASNLYHVSHSQRRWNTCMRPVQVCTLYLLIYYMYLVEPNACSKSSNNNLLFSSLTCKVYFNDGMNSLKKILFFFSAGLNLQQLEAIILGIIWR